MIMFTENVRIHATKSCAHLVKPKLTNAIYGAGLSYSKCHAELKVPVDPHSPYVFDGEEFNRAARYWTYGYDIYTPHRVYVLHNYPESQSNPTTGSWRRKIDRTALENSNRRLRSVIDVPGGFSDRDEVIKLKKSKYGLGDRRSLDELIQFSGIDLRNRKVTIDGKNRCGNLRWVDFEEHPQGVNYIPKFDGDENPLDEPDESSVWYNKALSEIIEEKQLEITSEKQSEITEEKQSRFHSERTVAHPRPYLKAGVKSRKHNRISELLPPRQSATAKLEKDTLHPVILKTKSLRALKNILVAENLTQHGINKLPVLIRLSVLLLLLGLAISIILTKGTGNRRKKKRMA